MFKGLSKDITTEADGEAEFESFISKYQEDVGEVPDFMANARNNDTVVQKLMDRGILTPIYDYVGGFFVNENKTVDMSKERTRKEYKTAMHLLWAVVSSNVGRKTHMVNMHTLLKAHLKEITVRGHTNPQDTAQLLNKLKDGVLKLFRACSSKTPPLSFNENWMLDGCGGRRVSGLVSGGLFRGRLRRAPVLKVLKWLHNTGCQWVATILQRSVGIA